MTKTTRKNEMVKAFQSMLALEEKRHQNINGSYIRVERQMIGAVSNRGENLTCEQVKDYCNNYLQVIGEGISKVAYGMDDIVISFNNRNIVNQVKAQIDFWNKVALTPDSDYFNPVLSYGLHRGDKVYKEDNRYIDKSFIVSQRAQVFTTLEETIKQMFLFNHKAFNGRDIENYKRRLLAAAKRNGIKDIHNGNFGLVYDYSKGEYKAVIIDYSI